MYLHRKDPPETLPSPAPILSPPPPPKRPSLEEPKERSEHLSVKVHKEGL